MKAHSIRTGIVALSLAITALGAAQAQVPVAISGQSMFDTLGVVTAYGYVPPRYPSTWIVPQFVVQHPAAYPPYLWIERVRPVIVAPSVPTTDALPVQWTR